MRMGMGTVGWRRWVGSEWVDEGRKEGQRLRMGSGCVHGRLQEEGRSCVLMLSSAGFGGRCDCVLVTGVFLRLGCCI